MCRRETVASNACSRATILLHPNGRSARDTRTAAEKAIVAAKDYPALQDAAQALDKAARDLRLAVKGENLRLPAARVLAASVGVNMHTVLHPYRRLMFYIMRGRNESVVYFDAWADAGQRSLCAAMRTGERLLHREAGEMADQPTRIAMLDQP